MCEPLSLVRGVLRVGIWNCYDTGRIQKNKEPTAFSTLPQIVTNCVIEIYVRQFWDIIGYAESRQPCSESDVTCSNDIYYGQFIGAARLHKRTAISHFEINFRGILQANARGCNVPTLLPERSLALELSLSFVFLVANWISVLWLSVNFSKFVRTYLSFN